MLMPFGLSYFQRSLVELTRNRRHIALQPKPFGFRGWCSMTFHKQNQGWLIGLGVLVALLWTAQISSGWFKPNSEIELVNLKKIELAHTIPFEFSESGRADRAESKSDPVASVAALDAHDGNRRGLDPVPDSTTATGNYLTSVLPGIRAPPF